MDSVPNYSDSTVYMRGTLIPGTCLSAGLGFVDESAHLDNKTGTHPNGGTLVLLMVHKAL